MGNSFYICLCLLSHNSFFSSELILDPEKVGLSCFSFKKRSLTQLKRSRRCLTLGRIFQNGVEGNFSTPTLVGWNAFMAEWSWRGVQLLSSSLKIISFLGETVLSNRLLRAVERILARRRNFVEYRFDTDVVEATLVPQLLLKKANEEGFCPYTSSSDGCVRASNPAAPGLNHCRQSQNVPVSRIFKHSVWDTSVT